MGHHDTFKDNYGKKSNQKKAQLTVKKDSMTLIMTDGGYPTGSGMPSFLDIGYGTFICNQLINVIWD